ncbi:DASH complex subunit Dad2 [Phytophthora cactorum]|nr:DASH complex subunit Dad2 [Phytophthora cactorum]
MASSKNEEVEALEALRDKSAELVRYLDNMNDKLLQMNEQNEMSLRVLENWSSVIAISKVSSASTAAASAGKPQAEKKLKPFSRDQVTSWIVQLILIGSFITFVSTLLSWDKCLAILLPNAFLVIIVITSWCICELRDPSKPKPSSSFFPSILKVPPKESRYCGLCYKNSPGLDHHCTWLNTCIAESNYEAFYWLVVSAACQTLLQTVIGILMCTLWESEVKANAADGWDKAVIALLWIHNAACISLTNSFVLLAGFHTYLLCVGVAPMTSSWKTALTACAPCNCLRRKKTRNGKRSHVQHGDVKDSKSTEGAATRTRRGSAPASIFPASLSAPPSIQSQTSLQYAVAAAALELSKGSDTSRELLSPGRTSANPTEVAVAATQPDMILSERVNESEGIFEQVDLSSPSKMKKLSGAMRHVAALLLCVLGGNATPAVADLEKVVKAFGGEFDQEQAEKLLKELEGKNIEEVIEAGKAKLATVSVGAAPPLALLLVRCSGQGGGQGRRGGGRGRHGRRHGHVRRRRGLLNVVARCSTRPPLSVRRVSVFRYLLEQVATDYASYLVCLRCRSSLLVWQMDTSIQFFRIRYLAQDLGAHATTNSSPAHRGYSTEREARERHESLHRNHVALWQYHQGLVPVVEHH